MTKETRKALEDSIQHWKRMREKPNGSETPTWDQCPLCRLFYNQSDRCHGCPVRDATGYNGCAGTPYYEAELRHELAWGSSSPEVLQEWHKAADKMIAFLENLIPQTKENTNG